MTHLFRAWTELAITGPEPIRCLNRLSAENIAFWRIRRSDETHLRLRVYRRDRAKAERAALHALCTAEKTAAGGFPVVFGGLRRRPVLLLGTLLALALSILAQGFVWVVRIEPVEGLSEARIRHALTEEGIGFGSWGWDISSYALSMRMQLRLPELGWLAANREGGVLTILTGARRQEQPPAAQVGPANVVAARAGIVQSVNAYRGTAAVEPGDAVLAGQLLISGITTWEKGSYVTRASGEVYALTSRQYTLKIPIESLEKRYTGETETALCVIFGRNRRKIFGNSSISQGTCDKITDTRVWTLPGGDVLPVTVERTTYRAYTLEPVTLDAREARRILEQAALRDARANMIAGRILQSTFALTEENGCYVLRGEISCEEMISRTAPISIIGEDEAFGKAHQRGTD